MLRYNLQGLYAFPNIVINVNIARRSGKKNRETDVDHCQECWCIDYMVCAHSLIW